MSDLRVDPSSALKHQSANTTARTGGAGDGMFQIMLDRSVEAQPSRARPTQSQTDDVRERSEAEREPPARADRVAVKPDSHQTAASRSREADAPAARTEPADAPVKKTDDETAVPVAEQADAAVKALKAQPSDKLARSDKATTDEPASPDAAIATQPIETTAPAPQPDEATTAPLLAGLLAQQAQPTVADPALTPATTDLLAQGSASPALVTARNAIAAAMNLAGEPSDSSGMVLEDGSADIAGSDSAKHDKAGLPGEPAKLADSLSKDAVAGTTAHAGAGTATAPARAQAMVVAGSGQTEATGTSNDATAKVDTAPAVPVAADNTLPATTPETALPQPQLQPAMAAPQPTSPPVPVPTALAGTDPIGAVHKSEAAHQAHLAAKAAASDETGTIHGLAIDISSRARAGGRSFEIRLDPPELGRVEVRLEVEKDGTLSTRLMVERPETLDLLQRDARQLERALQSSGLNTNSGGLEFSLRDQSHSGRQDRQPQHENRAATLVIPEADLPPVAGAIAYGRLNGIAGGLDLKV